METLTERQAYLAQGGVLHGDLTEEEVDVVTVVDGVQEVRLCRDGEEHGVKTLLTSLLSTRPSSYRVIKGCYFIFSACFAHFYFTVIFPRMPFKRQTGNMSLLVYTTAEFHQTGF